MPFNDESHFERLEPGGPVVYWHFPKLVCLGQSARPRLRHSRTVLLAALHRYAAQQLAEHGHRGVPGLHYVVVAPCEEPFYGMPQCSP